MKYYESDIYSPFETVLLVNSDGEGIHLTQEMKDAPIDQDSIYPDICYSTELADGTYWLYDRDHNDFEHFSKITVYNNGMLDEPAATFFEGAASSVYLEIPIEIFKGVNRFNLHETYQRYIKSIGMD